MSQMAHVTNGSFFEFFDDDRKKTVTVCPKYLSTSERSY